jgi:hypothetical protein
MAIKVGDQTYVTAREAAKIIGVNRVRIGYFLMRNKLEGVIDLDDSSIIAEHIDQHENPLENKNNKTFLIPLESAIKKRSELQGKKNG